MLSGHWEKSWILTEELKDVMVRQQNGREREMQGDGRTVAETATALEATRSNVAAAENKVSSVKGECKALWEHRGKGQREQRTGRNIPDLQRVDKKERCNVDQWRSWQGERKGSKAASELKKGPDTPVHEFMTKLTAPGNSLVTFLNSGLRNYLLTLCRAESYLWWEHELWVGRGLCTVGTQYIYASFNIKSYILV